MANPTNRVFAPCRISFPRLSSAEFNKMSKKDEYSVVLVIPKDDSKTLNSIRSVMKEVFSAKYPNPKNWPLKFKQDNFFEEYLSPDGKDGFFLRDGDVVSDKNDKMANCVFFTARDGAKAPKKPHAPECAIKEGKKVIKITGDRIEEELYAGCEAIVVFDVYTYPEDSNNQGIGASLKAVIKTGDNERWGGSAPVDLSEFGEVEEESSILEEGLENL
jgi:hypothetical protein